MFKTITNVYIDIKQHFSLVIFLNKFTTSSGVIYYHHVIFGRTQSKLQFKLLDAYLTKISMSSWQWIKYISTLTLGNWNIVNPMSVAISRIVWIPTELGSTLLILKDGKDANPFCSDTSTFPLTTGAETGGEELVLSPVKFLSTYN